MGDFVGNASVLFFLTLFTVQHFWMKPFILVTEFVLGPANKKQFDEINTQTLVFYVKGEQIASIALSEEPGDQRQYNVKIVSLSLFLQVACNLY